MVVAFRSVAELDAAFRLYVESVRAESLASLVQVASDEVEQRYRNLPYPISVAGEEVSSVPPAEIAAAVRASIVGSSGAVYLDPEMMDADWSARRYAALTVNGNPFASVVQELQSGQQIAEITGLKTHP
jgi:hypothetical protein